MTTDGKDTRKEGRKEGRKRAGLTARGVPGVFVARLVFTSVIVLPKGQCRSRRVRRDALWFSVDSGSLRSQALPANGELRMILRLALLRGACVTHQETRKASAPVRDDASVNEDAASMIFAEKVFAARSAPDEHPKRHNPICTTDRKDCEHFFAPPPKKSQFS